MYKDEKWMFPFRDANDFVYFSPSSFLRIECGILISVYMDVVLIVNGKKG